MPFAVSVHDLWDIISQYLQQKFPDAAPAILSSEWIRLQFWPSNLYIDQAIGYSGRFKLKFGIQIRQLYVETILILTTLVHYYNIQGIFQFIITLAVVILVSVDNKAIIPVGEPHCPVSTGVCGHNKSLVPLSGCQVQALDHDFHIYGIVPSVAFFIDVPENVSDYFFRGVPFVT